MNIKEKRMKYIHAKQDKHRGREAFQKELHHTLITNNHAISSSSLLWQGS